MHLRLVPWMALVGLGLAFAPSSAIAETFRLGDKNPLPPYLLPADTIVVEKGGIRDKDRHYIRTKAKDFLTKDFRLEVVFTTTETRNGLAFIGIGAADRGGRFFEPASSVYLRIHPPDLDRGSVGLSKAAFKPGTVIGRLPVGRHRAIIEKKGKAVLFAIDVNHDGPTKNDLAYTVLDIKAFAPFLNARNTHVFFGGGGLYEEVALSDKTGAALFKPRPLVKMTPPVLKPTKVEVKLPGGFDSVRTGGAGRYLIFHIKAKNKLVVFDAVKAKLTHEIEAPNDVVFAAGLEKLLVAMPGSRQLQRWGLASGVREKTVPIPGIGAVRTALMGSAGKGPFLLFIGKQFVRWDVDKMRVATADSTGLGGERYSPQGRISADGQTLTVWHAGISPTQYALVRFGPGKNTVLRSPDGHSMNERWAMPNADGSLIFRTGPGIYDRNMREVAAGAFKDMVLLPTEDARFFLAVREESATTNQVLICSGADRRIVLKIGGVEKMTGSSMNTRWGQVLGEPRVRYLPSANLLVNLPESNDRVVIRSVSLMKR